MAPEARPDLSVIVVSYNAAEWIGACLSSVFGRAGSARLDVVLVDNASSDGTAQLVAARFPQVRQIASQNRGFAHANNLALMTATARHVLLLNPDTEIVDGDLGSLITWLDEHPDIGLAGVRQITADGELYPTIRRFPNAARALGDAVTSERWPMRPPWLGERELDRARYERECECDWTTGAFMLVRRDAILSAGLLDERLFLYSEEPDLCLRLRRAGWRIVHTPAMTIVHHAGKAGVSPRLSAQEAFSRRVYAGKHFAAPHRTLYLGALATRYALRGIAPGGNGDGARRRAAARGALRTLLGRDEPPFGEPPPTAIGAATGGRTAT